jgi:hypothetical protein
MNNTFSISKHSQNIFRFYIDGFRSMTLGRTLWKLILIKLLIMFGVLKVFFFEDYLGSRFATNEEKATFVLEQMIQPVAQDTFIRGAKND